MTELNASQVEFLDSSTASINTDVLLTTGEKVKKALDEFREHTGLPARRDDVLMISSSDVDIQCHLGHRGFSSFYKISLLHSKAPNDTYSLKRIDSDTRKDEALYPPCAIKAALEAEMLSRISHRHVVKVVALHAANTVESFDKQRNFVVLDYLVDTLDAKLDEWMLKGKPSKHLFDRLDTVAISVVTGLTYLHQNNILHRNIRPAAVGFDIHGNCKITDFAIAKDMTVVDALDEKLGGLAGSPRYMAPEVASKAWYGLAADVYSFSVLLWEIATLTRPFYTYVHHDKIISSVLKGERPPTNKVSCKPLKDLIVECWNADPTSRRSIQSMHKQLLQILADLENNGNKSSRLLQSKNNDSSDHLPAPPGHKSPRIGRKGLFRRRSTHKSVNKLDGIDQL